MATRATLTSISLVARSRALPAAGSLNPKRRPLFPQGFSVLGRSVTVLVDGSGHFDAALRKVQAAVGDGLEPLDIVTVTQRGIAQALVAAARLESSSTKAKPTFIVQGMTVEQARPHIPENFKLRGNERFFKVALPPAAEWKLEGAPESRAKGTDKLIVGNNTEVMKLAKATMARASLLEPGMSISIETSIRGQASPLNLRLQHLAQVVMRAHNWQVNPVDRSRPVRPFRCAAALRKVGGGGGGGDAAGNIEKRPGFFEAAPGYAFLVLEVLPEGPVGGIILEPKEGDK